jgi:hypothetical protein
VTFWYIVFCIIIALDFAFLCYTAICRLIIGIVMGFDI